MERARETSRLPTILIILSAIWKMNNSFLLRDGLKKRARKLNVVSEDEISRMGRDRSGNREEGTKAIRIFDEYSSRLWGGGRIENWNVAEPLSVIKLTKSGKWIGKLPSHRRRGKRESREGFEFNYARTIQRGRCVSKRDTSLSPSLSHSLRGYSPNETEGESFR